MTGAELLALARHSRGAGESDADTAQHLVSALSLIWRQLPAERQAAVALLLQQLMVDDMIRRNVRNDYSDLQVGITPWTRTR